MQKTGNGNTDTGEYRRRLLVDLDGTVAHVICTDRQHAIDTAFYRSRDARLVLERIDLFDEILAIDEPDLAEYDEPVGGKDYAESSDCGSECWLGGYRTNYVGDSRPKESIAIAETFQSATVCLCKHV